VVTGIAVGIANVVTNVGGLNNQAENVVVQPADGKIVVSGSSLNPGSSGVGIDHHTDLARYLPDGQPDPAFGAGGTLTLDAFVGADLAIQPTAGSCSSARPTPRRRAHRRAVSPSCR
jgi:Domain of unknown function (DUF5122) beta-propeller